MVWNFILPALGNAVVGGLIGGATRPRDNTSGAIADYQRQIRELRPDTAYAMQDPAVQALEKEGIRAGQMAQQRALQQLMSQGFKGSTLTPQLSQQSGIQAQQPYLTQRAGMISNIADRDYRQQADALRMALQGRLGLAQQQAQHDTGFGLLGMKGIMGDLGGIDWSNLFGGQ